jgi:transposase
LKKTWCIGVINSRFIAKMEQILWLYAQSYAAAFPVVCFDERPCFLLGEVVAPLNPQPGKPAKEHYAYTKNGSCALLAAIEPLTGKRVAKLYGQRTKREYALFLKEVSLRYPEAVQIRLVQDNLNTHDLSALYETFEAEEAFALAQRFEFFFTPKSASWLNMIEIEFSALSRQCLNRRIPTREQMEREVLALVQERERKGIKIHWQFSLQAARNKFQRHYGNLRRDPESATALG